MSSVSPASKHVSRKGHIDHELWTTYGIIMFAPPFALLKYMPSSTNLHLQSLGHVFWPLTGAV